MIPRTRGTKQAPTAVGAEFLARTDGGDWHAPCGPPVPIPRMRDSEGGYCRPSSFLALERDGRIDAFVETETMGRIPPKAGRDGPAGS